MLECDLKENLIFLSNKHSLRFMHISQGAAIQYRTTQGIMLQVVTLILQKYAVDIYICICMCAIK